MGIQGKHHFERHNAIAALLMGVTL